MGRDGRGLGAPAEVIAANPPVSTSLKSGYWTGGAAPTFEKAIFESMIAGMKFNPEGMLIITLVVPYQSSITEALKLRGSFGIMSQTAMYRKRYAKQNPELVASNPQDHPVV